MKSTSTRRGFLRTLAIGAGAGVVTTAIPRGNAASPAVSLPPGTTPRSFDPPLDDDKMRNKLTRIPKKDVADVAIAMRRRLRTVCREHDELVARLLRA